LLFGYWKMVPIYGLNSGFEKRTSTKDNLLTLLTLTLERGISTCAGKKKKIKTTHIKKESKKKKAIYCYK
jgi:hypothetical protein